MKNKKIGVLLQEEEYLKSKINIINYNAIIIITVFKNS